MKIPQHLLCVTFFGSLALPSACGSDSNGAGAPAPAPEHTGQACTAAAQCFPHLVDGGAINGTVVCLDRVPDGYCTHECQADSDCCAVPGECATSFPQVCSPFESTGKKYCFLSCEDADIRAHETELFRDGSTIDANLFCETRANAAFGCRSSGGGSQNRKVCTP